MLKRWLMAAVVLAAGATCALVFWPRPAESPREFRFEPSYYKNPEAVQDAERRRMI